MVSTEELEVIRAVDSQGGTIQFKLLKRLVLPYRPHAIEEMCWDLNKSGYLELSLNQGLVKVTERGVDLLNKSYYYRRERDKKLGKTKSTSRS